MRKPWALLAVALCASPVFAQDPPAQDDAAEAPTAADAPKPLSESLTGAALDAYEAGKLLYVDGDFAGARLKFDNAYELSKDYRLLWNVAAAEKNLRHYAAVIRALERYLAEGAGKLSDSDRAEAERLLSTVGAFVARVQVVVNVQGAKVLVDGEPLGQTPLAEGVLIDQGSHLVRVEKAGYEPYEKRQAFKGGEEATVDVKLSPAINDGRLRVVAGLGDVIAVDGRVVGKGTWEGKLPAGSHTVSVSAKGKLPYQAEVLVQKGQLNTTRVSLERERVIREEAGFWAGPWPWVIGGAVLATGAGVGAYFALRPDDEPAPDPIVGSLDPGTVEISFF